MQILFELVRTAFANFHSVAVALYNSTFNTIGLHIKLFNSLETRCFLSSMICAQHKCTDKKKQGWNSTGGSLHRYLNDEEWLGSEVVRV